MPKGIPNRPPQVMQILYYSRYNANRVAQELEKMGYKAEVNPMYAVNTDVPLPDAELAAVRARALFWISMTTLVKRGASMLTRKIKGPSTTSENGG